MYSITIHNLGTTCLEETIQNRYLSKLIALSLHMTKHLVKLKVYKLGITTCVLFSTCIQLSSIPAGYASCYSLKICTRAFGLGMGEITSDN